MPDPRRVEEARAKIAAQQSGLVTVGQAAAILGLSYQRTDQLVTEGRIPIAERVGRFRMLDRATVHAFAGRERSTGRPKSESP